MVSLPLSKRRKLCCGLEYVRHRNPLGYLFVTFVYLWWAIHTHIFFNLIVIPRWENIAMTSFLGLLIVMYSWNSAMVIVSLTRCVLSRPGVVEESYEEIITDKMQRSNCDRCGLIRPRRAHHCRMCGVCIRLFDHHCPWINNCVGEDNVWLFSLLIFYSLAQSLSMFATLCYYLKFLSPLHDVTAGGGGGDDVMGESRGFLQRNEWRVIATDAVASFLFCIAMFNQSIARYIMVRTETTAFQSVTDPDYLLKLRLRPCHSAFGRLFGTRSCLLWLVSPLRRHTPTPVIISDQPEPVVSRPEPVIPDSMSRLQHLANQHKPDLKGIKDSPNVLRM